MTFINANVLSNFVSLQCLSSLLNALLQNMMAEQNVPAQPPTKTDEQIVPRSLWLIIGKSNLLFNAQKIQKNPIFQISVDILSNTNFFQAFTASANVPAIYLQQFWKTMSYNEKTGVYSCQVDEQWFDLSADLLRKALAITPVNPTHPFELPPSGDTVIDFVNELGYPEPVEIVSSIRTNYVYQPWRAILCLLNQCLTGKTSGSDKPRHPVLQMLWGIVTQTNVDHAELIWEEFTQGIQTFFSHKASHKASLKNPKKKVTPLLIPYGRFSKVIIYYLARNNNIHRRPDSAVHHTGDDYVLGNLKFVPKGESVEVFGMAIPDPLITEAIRRSSYYPTYVKMVAENTKKTPQGSARVQPATQRATPKKPTTTTPVKQTKPAPPPSKKPSKRKLPQKVRKGKPAFQLVDEEDEAQQESIPQREDDDPDLELAKKLSLETPQEKREGEGDDADLERAIKLSLDPAFLPQGRAPVGGVTIRDPVSEATPKLHEVVGKGKAVVTEEQEVKHYVLSNPGIAHRLRWTRPDTNAQKTKLDQTLDNLHVSLLDQTLSTCVDELIATAYPKKLEQERSEVKKTDVWWGWWDFNRSQIPTAVVKLSTEQKLDDALLKSLSRIKNRPKRVRRRFIKARKDKVEGEQDSTYSYQVNSEVDIERRMKTAMDKEVSRQLDQTQYGYKREVDLIYAPASGSSAKPPLKADDQSSKKPGNQLTHERLVVDSSMHGIRSRNRKHSDQSLDDFSMQDEGLSPRYAEDNDNATIPMVPEGKQRYQRKKYDIEFIHSNGSADERKEEALPKENSVLMPLRTVHPGKVIFNHQILSSIKAPSGSNSPADKFFACGVDESSTPVNKNMTYSARPYGINLHWWFRRTGNSYINIHSVGVSERSKQSDTADAEILVFYVDGTLERSNGKAGPKWFKDFHLFRVLPKGMETRRSSSEVTKDTKADELHHSKREEKTTDRGSIKEVVLLKITVNDLLKVHLDLLLSIKVYRLKELELEMLEQDVPCNYGVIGERRYGVSVPAVTKDHKGIKLNTPYLEDQYAVLEIWNGYNILEDIKRGPYSKKSPIRCIQSLDTPVTMDDPNITMEEYIRLEEEKARRRGKVYNWKTPTYGKIWDNEDVHDLGSVEIEFPAIVFNDMLTSEVSLSCEATVSSLNDNEIDFRISFDESDDEDYTVIFDKNLFSYKIISVNDLKTDSENDNEKVNMPSFPSPKPTISFFDDLDFFKDFENEFPAIVYNNAQTSKSDLLTEPILNPQHIDEFNLKDETSLSECDEEEQNVLNFNDLFPFNVIYPNDSKSDKDNDDDKIDIEHSSGDLSVKLLPDVINTDVGAYAHGSNKL
ncbi:hypothetical protein Tco_1465307 [Tanacetum coccineum]